MDATNKQSNTHPFVGKFVIARCTGAGVHAGTLVWCEGELAILHDARRLWEWHANDGVALSGLAWFGLKTGKLDTVTPEIYLTGVCELIPTTGTCAESIMNFGK